MSQGHFNPAYVGRRGDIEKLIPSNAKLVLDIGCSIGTLGASIKESTGAQVYGIELSKEMAQEAASRLDKVMVGDAAEILAGGEWSNCRFDVIIFADVLEHMIDPWSVLKTAIRLLDAHGRVIASIPNIRHIDTVYNLVVKGYWPYRERGIHDRTHLRFFTKKNIMKMFAGAGLSIETIQTNYRIFEAPHRLNRYAQYLAFPIVRNFLAFQYLVRAGITRSLESRTREHS